jgi:exodeoxyribonuclease VII large subunit
MERQVLSVGQINDYIRNRLDNDPGLRNIAIRGELSNYKVYPSGHHYFTIKDGTGAMKCVMFKSAAMRLRFRPENGMQVIAMGSVAVYVRDGVYQLYCTGMVMDGIGDLYAAFEQLKAKLSAQGLFDQAHKKPLPKLPGTIGIVTSSAGAAVHDMLRILRKRYPLTQVKLLPVRVQGAEAPAEIAGAIHFANRHQLADLIITGRGGGSIEDLWAFNDVKVAYAIAASQIPVISAVGHEPDVTISDYVADLRAATPSNGAELAVPDQMELKQQLAMKQALLTALITERLKQERGRLNTISKTRVLSDPMGYVSERRMHLDLLQERMLSLSRYKLSKYQERFTMLTAKLDAMSPLKVLSRGYTVTMNSQGQLLRSVKGLSPGQSMTVRFEDGQATTLIQEVSHEPEFPKL